MGVLRVKSYHSGKQVSNGLAYSENKEKTTYKEKELNEYERELSNILNYSENVEKTLLQTPNGEKILVSGHRCIPEEAMTAFMLSRQKYLAKGHKEISKKQKAKRIFRAKLDENGEVVCDKEGKLIYDENAPVYRDKETGKAFYESVETSTRPRLAYMWMMSFPGKNELSYELSPEVVHEIGIRFCKEFLPDYAASISTHVNTDHYHNHIVCSAYSLDGSRKYDDSMANLNKARELCDELSLEYGIPIILNPSKNKSMCWTEWNQRREGHSWKEQLRYEIKTAAELSSSFEEYKEIMINAGYRLRETERHLTYYLPAVIYGTEYVCRDSMLNIQDDPYDYSKDGIIEYLAGRDEIERTTREGTSVRDMLSAISSVQRYTLDERRRSDIEVILVEALKALSLVRDAYSSDQGSGHKENAIGEYSAAVENTLKKLEELNIFSYSDLRLRIDDLGRSLSIKKKEIKNLGNNLEQNKRIIKKIDDADFYKDALVRRGIALEGLSIKSYEGWEIREKMAQLDPMRGSEKRELYLLLAKNPNIKVSHAFNELSRNEGIECIRYLEGRSDTMPAVMYNSLTDVKRSLETKYDRMYIKCAKKLKEKNEGRAASDAQKKMIRNLIEKGTVPADKAEEFMISDINMDELSFYDAFRLINYLKPGFSVKKKDGKEAMPSDSDLSLARELITARDNCEGFNLEELSKPDVQSLINYLLYKGKRPEILKSRSEIEREKADTCFERNIASFDVETRKALTKERELLNDLASMGITQNDFKEIRDSLTKNIEEETKEIRNLKIMKSQYRELKRIEFMARMAKDNKLLPFEYRDIQKHDLENGKQQADITVKKEKEQKREKPHTKRSEGVKR